MKVISKNKISWEIRDNIGYVSFTDPPKNLMDSDFFDELQELTEVIIPASTIEAIIIAGSHRHFSAGADLNELMRVINAQKAEKREGALLSNYRSFSYLSELNIPVIAAIKGVCIGSALELAMHCHFRLSSEDAILGLPESTFGLIPGVGGIPKLLELAGKEKTMELVLRGNTFNAADALNWNIVDAVYNKKNILDKAIELAKIAMKNYRKYNKMDYLKLINASDKIPDQVVRNP